MSYVDFLGAGHRYLVDGREVPSVTQVLEPLYDWSGIPSAVLQEAAARGTAVHKACELHDLEVLDESSLDADIAAYLDGWKRFLADTHFRIERVEARVHSPTYDYAGTTDRTGRLGRNSTVLDIKSGVMTPVTGPQTAAYERALTEQTGAKFSRRYGVYLRPNDYRLIRYDASTDWLIFQSARNLNTWRQNHGIE